MLGLDLLIPRTSALLSCRNSWISPGKQWNFSWKSASTAPCSWRRTQTLTSDSHGLQTKHKATLEDLISLFNLWFQILYLLQELIVLLHQLIVAFGLGLFKLQTQKEVNTRVALRQKQPFTFLCSPVLCSEQLHWHMIYWSQSSPWEKQICELSLYLLLKGKMSNQCIILFSQMFLFGLCLVDLLRSPPIHLPLQLFFLSATRGQFQTILIHLYQCIIFYSKKHHDNRFILCISARDLNWASSVNASAYLSQMSLSFFIWILWLSSARLFRRSVSCRKPKKWIFICLHIATSHSSSTEVKLPAEVSHASKRNSRQLKGRFGGNNEEFDAAFDFYHFDVFSL